MSKTLYYLQTPFRNPECETVAKETDKTYVLEKDVAYYKKRFLKSEENIVHGTNDELFAFTTDPLKLPALARALSRALFTHRKKIRARHSECMEAITKFIIAHVK